jgi:hypothetical protein
MPGRILRRFTVLGFALCVSLLPLTGAHAAPARDSGSQATISIQIQRFGRTLLQAIEMLVQGPPPSSSSQAPPGPSSSDGVGIDPHGGFRP